MAVKVKGINQASGRDTEVIINGGGGSFDGGTVEGSGITVQTGTDEPLLVAVPVENANNFAIVASRDPDAFYDGTATGVGIYVSDDTAILNLSKKPDGPSGSLSSDGLSLSSSDGQLGVLLETVPGGSVSLADFIVGGSPVLSIDPNGYLTVRKHTAPADANIAMGELRIWFDFNTAAPKVMFKAKDDNGTIRTGSLALT